jgi:DNA polymerase V
MQCVGLDDSPSPKKEIACTRSFGHPVMELSGLTEAVTEFASRAVEKVRKQNSLAADVMVFIRTSPFRKDAQYSRSIVVPLLRPSADTGVIVQAAVMGLQAIFMDGYKYAKAGVMLLDLQSNSIVQGELDLEDGTTQEEIIEKSRLMMALDTINKRFGRGTMKMASAGLDGDRRVWSMKQERRTPAYTTSWTDIPVAKA